VSVAAMGGNQAMNISDCSMRHFSMSDNIPPSVPSSVLNRPVRRPGTAVLSEFLLGWTGRRKIRPSRPSI